MRSKFPVFLLLCLLCALPGAAFAAPQEGDRLTAPYLPGTVRVETDADEGFGFAVGERDGDLYLVTAAHVVADPGPGQPARVRLYFHADPARAVPAEVLVREPRLDAALLRVAKPRRLRWRAPAYCTPPFERGEPAWFIGRERRWFVPLDRDAGRLPHPEPDWFGRIELSIDSVKPGTSGAPLIGRRGLIGMITDDGGIDAAALAVRNLRRFVTYYRYPWGLLECGAQPGSVVTVAAAPREPEPRSEPEPEPTKTWTDPVTGMEFVWIDGGCFRMGSPPEEAGRDGDERPHRVCVHEDDGFWMARTEVTNAQFRRFRPEHDSGDYTGHGLNGDDHPVAEVSWKDATAFADWLSNRTGKTLRLPTEAEWEYAARAGTETARYWGNDPNRACDYANGYDQTGKEALGFDQTHHDCEDGFAVTAPVGRFEPNAWGLNDMLGNLWEWTCSEWDSDYGGDEGRCSGKNHAEGLRSVRGGSWGLQPAWVRSAYRNGYGPGDRFVNLGFRLARIK